PARRPRGAPPTLDPGAGGYSVGAPPAVGEAPAAIGPHQIVEVPAPVVGAAVGHGEEVATGPGPIRRLRLDHHVADVVPDPGRARAGREVAAGAGDEGPDRVPTPVCRLALAPRGPAGGGKGGESV